jgi:hypothetical protein
LKRLFYVEGKFSWALIIAIGYLSLSLLIADYVWRILVAPINMFVLSAIAIDTAVAITLVGTYRFFRVRKF